MKILQITQVHFLKYNLIRLSIMSVMTKLKAVTLLNHLIPHTSLNKKMQKMVLNQIALEKRGFILLTTSIRFQMSECTKFDIIFNLLFIKFIIKFNH